MLPWPVCCVRNMGEDTGRTGFCILTALILSLIVVVFACQCRLHRQRSFVALILQADLKMVARLVRNGGFFRLQASW